MTTECPHCAQIRAELERCRPLTPTPSEWGERPYWGVGNAVRGPLFAKGVGSCNCQCHSAFRMLTRIRS
jgi:hypothetical protein